MDKEEWQTRLESAFEERGIVGGRLSPILQLERAHSDHVLQRFHPYLVLADSFLSFFLETLAVAQKRVGQTRDSERPFYRSVMRGYAILFQKFRATENLLLSGYPLSGYALLRDVKDQAIIHAALARGDVRYVEVIGLEGVTVPKDGTCLAERLERYRTITNNRKRCERRIFKQTTGITSGFDEPTQLQFRRWDMLFNMEVHGGRLSGVQQGSGWLKGSGRLPIAPCPDDQTINLYMHRLAEIGWMVLRVLPFLQVTPGAFGEVWAQKWRLLDQSLSDVVAQAGKTGNQLAPALADLVSEKFAFHPDATSYREREAP